MRMCGVDLNVYRCIVYSMEKNMIRCSEKIKYSSEKAFVLGDFDYFHRFHSFILSHATHTVFLLLLSLPLCSFNRSIYCINSNTKYNMPQESRCGKINDSIRISTPRKFRNHIFDFNFMRLCVRATLYIWLYAWNESNTKCEEFLPWNKRWWIEKSRSCKKINRTHTHMKTAKESNTLENLSNAFIWIDAHKSELI